MKKIVFTLLFSAVFAAALSAQTVLPRLFLDIPYFYVAAPNAEKAANLAGLGLEAAMNFGTHWSTARVGLGVTETLDPKADDVKGTFATTPYALLEAGVGAYRTNGNQCARTRANAFTAMAKVGLRYALDTRSLVSAADPLPVGLDYSAGVELGYFYISDVFRNTEFSLTGNYLFQAKAISAGVGFKFFLNLRAIGDR